jgi:hypothetical protein
MMMWLAASGSNPKRSPNLKNLPPDHDLLLEPKLQQRRNDAPLQVTQDVELTTNHCYLNHKPHTAQPVDNGQLMI